jgi:hypothetical protein
MFCGECGAGNPDTNRFCKQCGKALIKRDPGMAPVAGPVIQAPGSLSVQPVANKIKPARNWLAIFSLIVSLVSWVVYPVVIGAAAVVLGILSVVLAKKKHAKIPVSGIIAIIIGLLAIVLNFFWLDIFPPPAVMPPIK